MHAAKAGLLIQCKEWMVRCGDAKKERYGTAEQEDYEGMVSSIAVKQLQRLESKGEG